MLVAVHSTIVFEVPERVDVVDLQQKFLDAHKYAIGRPMETVTGQTYVLRAVERLEVEQR